MAIALRCKTLRAAALFLLWAAAGALAAPDEALLGKAQGYPRDAA